MSKGAWGRKVSRGQMPSFSVGLLAFSDEGARGHCLHRYNSGALRSLSAFKKAMGRRAVI